MEYRERFGCGFESFEGKGTQLLDATKETISTCPQYLARLPFVASCYEFISDFRDGRLANIFELPNAMYCYLSIISSEMELWQRTQNERLMKLNGDN